MKLNRKWMLVIALVLSLTMATAGTLAYLQDTDADVNVMTLGNVYIVQNEQERATDPDGTPTSDLDEYENDEALYPAVYEGTSIPWETETGKIPGNGGEAWKVVDDNEAVVDKFVTVTNTGKSAAYVRTFIAYEGDATYGPNGDYIHIVHNSTNVDPAIIVENHGVITIDGVDYTVFSYTYPEALEPGDTTIPSLKQVYLDKAAGNDVVEQYGDEYQILVVSQAVQAAGFDSAEDALEAAFPYGDSSTAAIAGWFGDLYKNGVINNEMIDSPSDNPLPDGWPSNNPPTYEDGGSWAELADTSWYDESETEFVIMTPEQLAGFAKLVDEGVTFEGKTVKLGKNIDLAAVGSNGEMLLFDPIGSYRPDTPFMGTFDGQGYTIKNMSQNTWGLNNGYHYGDLGLGLFGQVEDATIKDLTMDGAEISGESALCGIVASVAYGDCTFENITVRNSNCADYQYYAGGVVGWASGNHVYSNINVESSTTIAAQWGDFDNSIGGIIGGASGSAQILMEDCTVACRIDAYNDVTSSYQWYAYRRAGMLIGNSNNSTTNESGTTVATAPQLTCKNVTVIYDDWANYTYCEFAGKNWPYVRVQAGVSNSAYSNPRYGHPTDANGNTVVDDNHVHNDGEDHFIECTFDQLYGGGQGVYGAPTHEGVKVVYNNK